MRVLRFRCIRVGVLLAAAVLSRPALALQATLNHNAILRSGPSTSTAALEHLRKGDGVRLVNSRREEGYYHVRAGDGATGWVYSRFITMARTSPQAKRRADSREASAEAATAGSAHCDPELWSHVYHPSRLIVKQRCIAVTGTIVDATADQKKHHADGVRHEPDGDSHGWLQVDPSFQYLLNEGNKSYEGGNLVFEIVCRYPISQADARSACQGYEDRVQLPPVGSHVRIVGTYVQDTNHEQWNEIHPVTSITVVPQTVSKGAH